MWTVQQYQYNEAVLEGVLYIHDHAILNSTELTQGQYPFPTDRIIASNYPKEPNSPDLLAFYQDARLEQHQALVVKEAFTIYPNGTLFENMLGGRFRSASDLLNYLVSWKWRKEHCLPGQIQLAMVDSNGTRYREPDGSMFFAAQAQSDFLFVPSQHTFHRRVYTSSKLAFKGSASLFGMCRSDHFRHGSLNDQREHPNSCIVLRVDCWRGPRVSQNDRSLLERFKHLWNLAPVQTEPWATDMELPI
jgi:hypothetical protein